MPDRKRLRLRVGGAVQGIGFRPFVFRLATSLALTGWVNNSPAGVTIEIEGPAEPVDEFLERLEPERPAGSAIHGLEPTWLEPAGYDRFTIRPSETEGTHTALILPDLATCPDCRRELFDPADRRFRHPFINCTHCGPRFSVIESTPYDRGRTTMKGFPWCERCRVEYGNPADRRFHAEPIACPDCGPQVELWTARGHRQHDRDDAIREAVAALRTGAIIAVKGLGGFHLLVTARDEAAVRRLRERKRRGEKPFAVMFPTLTAVAAECSVNSREARALESCAAPIVLLRRQRTNPGSLPDAIAPGNPDLGVLLPYTPIHHLLLVDLGEPVVATSGNLTDEPICTDDGEALQRLGGIADLFLVHDRPIRRPVDDSVISVVLGRELVLRRARGFAPLPITLPFTCPPALAVGAHMKSTVAVNRGPDVFISQHLGDLESAPALSAFERAVEDLPRLLDLTPTQWVADAHPDYASTHFVRRQSGSRMHVQHHHAHVLACQAENEVPFPFLGIAWDGTGWGPDHTIWGGEFLLVDRDRWQRIGHLRPFRLPGAAAAAREPRRSALGLLHAYEGDPLFHRTGLPSLEAFDPVERTIVRTMLKRGLNSPVTTSVGRLFDAVASIVGIRQRNAFEGQAAMELEFAVDPLEPADAYALPWKAVPEALAEPGLDSTEDWPVGYDPTPPRWQADWGPLLDELLADLAQGVPVARMAARFHHALARVITEAARSVGLPSVVLAGGCFQNRHLLECSVLQLRAAGFRADWPQRVPPNDGGIALGQIVAAALAGVKHPG